MQLILWFECTNQVRRMSCAVLCSLVPCSADLDCLMPCCAALVPQVGLWMLVQHMRDRNYLAANDVYLKLAIGNAPWPIGEDQQYILGC